MNSIKNIWHEDKFAGFIVESCEGRDIFIDKYLQNAAPVIYNKSGAEEISSEFLSEAINKAGSLSSERLIGYDILVRLEDLFISSTLRDSLPKLMAKLNTSIKFTLTFTFRNSPPDWRPLLLWYDHLVRSIPKETIEIARLEGAFPELPEDIKEALCVMGFQLRHVACWPDSSGIGDLGRVSELAIFGFRVPVVCFVTLKNQNEVIDWIPRILQENQYSGFALPLALHSPYIQGIFPDDLLPDSLSYVELITRVFEAYPHYDEVLDPIRDMINSFINGGWNHHLQIPTKIKLFAQADGISCYRQIPSRARFWRQWQHVANESVATLASDLNSWHKYTYDWATNSWCVSCPWRFVCGGTDHSDESTLATKLSCEYRKSILHSLLLKIARQIEDRHSHFRRTDP